MQCKISCSFLWTGRYVKNKNHENFKYNVIVGNMYVQGCYRLAAAVGRIAARQSVKRENYSKFTRGILLSGF